MSRARAAWIAAGVVVLAALGYLVLRRRGAQVAVPASASSPALPVAAAPAPTPTPTVEVVDAGAWLPSSSATAVADDPAEAAEKPLATWARVAIVVVALMAFFAVSLLAKKGV